MPQDFSGSWRARLDESTFVTRTPRRLTASISQTAEWLHVEMHVSFEGDDDSRMTFDAPIAAADEARTCTVALARWMGNDLALEMRIESGGQEVVLRERWWLSADGAQLTMSHRDDVLAGQTVVFERE